MEDHVIKVCLGRSLRILEYHGIPWNIVESRGISCNHGRTLRILEYLGAGSILPRGVSQHHPQTEEVARARSRFRTLVLRGTYAERTRTLGGMDLDLFVAGTAVPMSLQCP